MTHGSLIVLPERAVREAVVRVEKVAVGWEAEEMASAGRVAAARAEGWEEGA